MDLQINGYAGVDFNAPQLSLDEVERVCARLEADGVEGVLATVITDALPRMAERIARLANFCEQSEQVRRVVRGVHVEGPFLNETIGYVGAHPAEHVRPASVDDVDRLIDAGGGVVSLMTLAPERDSALRVTRHLAEQGILVSAGHCDTPLDLLTDSIEAGLSLFTHLGNGCAAQVDRHDNIIQRALSLSDRLWLCFIADGIHVPWFALGNYVRCAGPERCIIVSDAIAAAGLGPGRYSLGELGIDVGPDRVARYGDTGYLAGSCTTLPDAASNLAEHLHLTEAQIHQMTHANPLAVLRHETLHARPN
ncbi:N-acetylglucosamine-6-phosphate deacetylase [Planctomycetales bacterium ZRK34]|nr:N-acetylglucosamine-6-phosphate deacetylase [Planctomycetales bacterium ZRK34]